MPPAAAPPLARLSMSKQIRTKRLLPSLFALLDRRTRGRLGRSRSFAFLCRRSPISIRSLILPLLPLSDEMRESKTSFVLGAEMPNGLQLLTYFKELSALHWTKMHFQQCYQAVFVFGQVQDG